MRLYSCMFWPLRALLADYSISSLSEVNLPVCLRDVLVWREWIPARKVNLGTDYLKRMCGTDFRWAMIIQRLHLWLNSTDHLFRSLRSLFLLTYCWTLQASHISRALRRLRPDFSAICLASSGGSSSPSFLHTLDRTLDTWEDKGWVVFTCHAKHIWI